MKIAFASCMCTRVFGDQPVWDQIGALAPDHLVLLGDSVYTDINAPQPPDQMSDDEFAQHLHGLYAELVAQPQFLRLVRSLPAGRVWSIWDDHDFLWNDACGGDLARSPVYREKIRISTACQRVFRAALVQGLPVGSFPQRYNDPVFWNPAEPALDIPSVALQPDTWLHLSDGRTCRTNTWLVSEQKRALLGEAQCARLDAVMTAHPEALHLLASGSTISGWKRYANDLKWLRNVAKNRRVVVLSGDIHRNEVDYFPAQGAGWGFHEFTSSGVAVRDAVVAGRAQQNFGLLTLEGDAVAVQFFQKGAEQRSLARRLSRGNWPV